MMELEVDNASFLLETLGKDCEPLQFVRELTENAVQAVKATPAGTGRVIWDVDWVSYDADGLVKLSCTDTGIGMSADELKRYINNLSASRHQQSIHGNLGLGAKVAAGPRNPHGMVYLSWKDAEQGASIQLYRSEKTEKWGLRQFELADGSFDNAMPLDPAVRPDVIAQAGHGTKVVLLGRSREDNTMEPPAGTENRSKWLARYLNQRYFRFPEDVEIMVREGWDRPRSETTVNKLRTVHGQRYHLDRASTASGVVPLADEAKAHWWILDERHAERRKKDATWASTGHRAALYQNELYELITPARGGYQKVQEFGIRFSYARVVIYVEPDLSSGKTAASTSRAELKIDGPPRAGPGGGEESAPNPPDAIRVLEEHTAAGSISEDHREQIRNRLKPLRDLYHPPGYRRRDNGKINLGDEDIGGVPRERGRKHEGEAESGGEGGIGGNVYALFQAPNGPEGDEVKADFLPKLDWVSVNHDPPTRTPPHLEDRAARYDRRQNWLEINEDFRVHQDTMARWKMRYADVPGSGAIVEHEVRSWYAQILVETVLGAHGLRQRSRYWDDQAFDAMLSEEALTAAVQPRYFIEERLKRDLANRLGQLASPVAA